MHGMQEADSCVAVPSMQISWTTQNRHTLLQYQKQARYAISYRLRKKKQYFVGSEVLNLLSCCQRSFLEVYSYQPIPLKIREFGILVKNQRTRLLCIMNNQSSKQMLDFSNSMKIRSYDETHSCHESPVGNRSPEVSCFRTDWTVPKCFEGSHRRPVLLLIAITKLSGDFKKSRNIISHACKCKYLFNSKPK